jgi:alpha-tubulin suppressor-like RCC1 family protein
MRLFPVSVINSLELFGKKILQISCGGWHTCVIASDQNSYCWGWNE